MRTRETVRQTLETNDLVNVAQLTGGVNEASNRHHVGTCPPSRERAFELLYIARKLHDGPVYALTLNDLFDKLKDLRHALETEGHNGLDVAANTFYECIYERHISTL